MTMKTGHGMIFIFYTLSPWAGSIFYFCKPECSFMVRQKLPSLTLFPRSHIFRWEARFHSFKLRSHYSPLSCPLTNWHPIVVLSGKITSSPNLCFLKYGCKESTRWYVTSCVNARGFILTPYSSWYSSQLQYFSCKSFWGRRNFLASSVAISWLLLVASLITTAMSFLSHCTQVTKHFEVSINLCLISHRVRVVNVSETVCEILGQFCIWA